VHTHTLDIDYLFSEWSKESIRGAGA